jgi:asparagine synthase (glutamine-hydrolysing)
MCGIAGILKLDGRPIPLSACRSLSTVMAHRGPDDEGFLLADALARRWVTAGGPDTPPSVYAAGLPFTPTDPVSRVSPSTFNLLFVNRRLAIQDLSPAGHLPMSTSDGRIWLAFNGQIYNFVELRRELAALGHTFTSSGDSEVILHAYDEWGTECFAKFNGMWAIAVWDVRRGTVLLSRDRLGIKPLYWRRSGDMIAFASEIKCLLSIGIPAHVYEPAAYDFITSGVVDHTEHTFFDGIQSFPPAHVAELTLDGRIVMRRFWDFSVSDALDAPEEDEAAAGRMRELFIDAVRLRLRSDVPVGSCLSGGLDSSAIVSVMSRLQHGDGETPPVPTFSSCSNDLAYDERKYIELVARDVGADTRYVFPTGEGFVEDLPALLWHQEEPFGGPSIYASWCVMRLTRQSGVTVLLDGQGADEQLLGYRKFQMFYLRELWRRGRRGQSAIELLGLLSSPAVLGSLNWRSAWRYTGLGASIEGISNLVKPEWRRRVAEGSNTIGFHGSLANRIKLDLTALSLPPLLRYEDKNSMAHSVETRLPFMDYRMVETLAALPMNQKLRRGWTKVVVRNALKGILPEAIRQRRSKRGFVVPERPWMAGTLGDRMAEAFRAPEFIDRFVDVPRLERDFLAFRRNQMLVDGRLFLRLFILENWGRRFIHHAEIKQPAA